MINDALSQAAASAIDQIGRQNLPVGVVQNVSLNKAYLNSGSQQGFKDGMNVIITRGRQQVASGQLQDVNGRDSIIYVKRSFLGIQPGDKVRAIFDVPAIAPELSADGSVVIQRPKVRGNNTQFVTTLLVLGLVLLSAYLSFPFPSFCSSQSPNNVYLSLHCPYSCSIVPVLYKVLPVCFLCFYSCSKLELV